MKVAIAFPRLLPTTMIALAGLLSLKSIDLVRAAVPAHAEEPGAKPVEHALAKPPEHAPAKPA